MQEVCPQGQLLLICLQLAAEVTFVLGPSCEQHRGAKAPVPQFLIQQQGRVSDARPRPSFQEKGGGSPPSTMVGWEEWEWQTERASNRSRGKDRRMAWETTGEWTKWKGNMKFEVTGLVWSKKIKGKRQCNEKDAELATNENENPWEAIVWNDCWIGKHFIKLQSQALPSLGGFPPHSSSCFVTFKGLPCRSCHLEVLWYILSCLFASPSCVKPCYHLFVQIFSLIYVCNCVITRCCGILMSYNFSFWVQD